MIIEYILLVTSYIVTWNMHIPNKLRELWVVLVICFKTVMLVSDKFNFLFATILCAFPPLSCFEVFFLKILSPYICRVSELLCSAALFHASPCCPRVGPCPPCPFALSWFFLLEMYKG